MKSYKGFILEYVKNEKYANAIFDQIIDKIKHIVPQVKYFKSFNIEYYKLKFNVLDGFNANQIKQIKEIILSYKDLLSRAGILLIFNLDIDQINIYYKDKYSNRVKPPENLYFITYITTVDKILKNGLNKDTIGSKYDFSVIDSNAIFAVDYKHLVYSSKKGQMIIKINTTILNNHWFIDETEKGDIRYVTYDPIPKEALELVEEYSSIQK